MGQHVSLNTPIEGIKMAKIGLIENNSLNVYLKDWISLHNQHDVNTRGNWGYAFVYKPCTVYVRSFSYCFYQKRSLTVIIKLIYHIYASV